MAADRPELIAGNVLRLGRRAVDEIFIADKRSPQAQDFKLASKEEAEAVQRKLGQLSVYDSDLTNPARARALMEKPEKYRLVFTLDVARIRETEFDLHVWRDPNPDGDRRLGADAHCVIENVWSADPIRVKDIRADLMRIAGPAGEPIDSSSFS